MYDIISKRFQLFLISGIVILIGIIAIVSPLGQLKWGTEFDSGTQMRISFDNPPSLNDLRKEVSSLGYPNAIVRSETELSGGAENFIIRLPFLSNEELKNLQEGLKTIFGEFKVLESSDVSPEIARETVRATAIAVIVAAVAMMIYIIWAFRKMPHPFRYGTCAVIALVHDVFISAAIFGLIARFMNWEIDLMFITGILTIIGYSINNTVVVFDRIRENVKMGISSNFEIIVNDSIVGTMSRCLNTSLTTVFALVALLLFVGASIQNFVVVLLIGIIAGTFDSICIAPSLLVVWEKKEWGRFLGKKPA